MKEDIEIMIFGGKYENWQILYLYFTINELEYNQLLTVNLQLLQPKIFYFLYREYKEEKKKGYSTCLTRF